MEGIPITSLMRILPLMATSLQSNGEILTVRVVSRLMKTF